MRVGTCTIRLRRCKESEKCFEFSEIFRFKELIFAYEEKNLQFCLYIRQGLEGGGALKALEDISAKNAFFWDGFIDYTNSTVYGRLPLSVPTVSASEYPRRSGNYALGDLVTALAWVKDNVVHFGGNPGAVTLLGQGSGASLVTAVTGVQAADGLYHRIWATGKVFFIIINARFK